ncbi:MAG: isoleucine--tRNA ligase [Acidobacteria bacterium]|nr:isoleucine--tRNA ligase [Acidobacteriota bacterium]
MDLSTVDLKKTVNLPQTDFPMKANLPQAEPKALERWNAIDLYGQIRRVRAGRPRYVLHDGPPYANGNIHLGHAFNKILKDFVVKSKSMAGFDSPYVPGWDCHGLPIEIKVDNELGKKKASMSIVEIRQECRKYAEKYVALQMKDFIRLGVLGDWGHAYRTMEAKYQAAIARAFVEFLDRGYVYKGLKPVNWCMRCRTALAEAEVEYENHQSPSIWVRFALTSDAAALDPALAGRTVYGVIWTTTPWTIPANLAIAYHPKFEYSAVDVNGDVYIVASELLAATASAVGWAEPRELARLQGARLEGTVFRHPFLERDSKGILGDHVTLEAGTGAVHTAPGHGHEDYVVGLDYGLPVYCPVDPGGRLFQAGGVEGDLPDELLGKSVWEANPLVIDILARHGALLGQKVIDHSYPHCWRCHKPTIFRGTEQWFIKMDHDGFRDRAMEAIRAVKWLPSWGEDRIGNMVSSRPDWCISRQRVWGVPIVAFTCADCGEKLTDPKVLHKVVDLFEEHTADVWYAREANDLVPAGTACAKCGSGNFTKENDILDVWFDSGSSHLAVLNENYGLEWPSDFYLEGGDQYRGWFQSSLLIGVGLKGASPYRGAATSGWTLDGEGRAMSKSLGNTIEPQEIINKYGAEVLRLWVSSVEFWVDVRLTETVLTRLTEAYRKLRNTFRYALGNLSDFDPVADAVPASEMLGIDQWILTRTDALVEQCRKHYDDFAFHRVYQALYNFATVDLSSLYFDILKDRLYTTAPRSHARRSAQTALYRIQHALMRLLAPLLSFTSDEAWGHMRRLPGDPDSVHMAEFPSAGDVTAGLDDKGRALTAQYERLMAVRETVLKSLEIARADKFIKASLEARVVLRAGSELLPLLEEFEAELPSLFITSQVDLLGHSEAELSVEIHKAGGVKCERCWKFTMDVGAHHELPTVCGPCAQAIEEGWGG